MIKGYSVLQKRLGQKLFNHFEVSNFRWDSSDLAAAKVVKAFKTGEKWSASQLPLFQTCRTIILP